MVAVMEHIRSLLQNEEGMYYTGRRVCKEYVKSPYSAKTFHCGYQAQRYIDENSLENVKVVEKEL